LGEEVLLREQLLAALCSLHKAAIAAQQLLQFGRIIIMSRMHSINAISPIGADE
jgi:hypothetical protein